ncbi:MAG: hypothetical protein HUJ96_03915 [Marinilabiliaceae bacterium]|nr:hypothetical protein [Marinilabiliaceae bacterium]
MKIIILLLFTLLITGCNKDNGSEIFQHYRNNSIDIKDKIKEIDLGDVCVSSSSRPVVAGNFLIITDFKAYETPINIFDINTYKHIVSFGIVGQGPTEIANMGDVAWNRETHELYVTDHGKLEILAFNMDSVIRDSAYPPATKFRLNRSSFPADYYYLNDSVSFCRTIEPIGNNDFCPNAGIWNMMTGDIEVFRYKHPEIDKNRFMLAVSYSDSIYAECNVLNDLISIFDLNGTLLHNIYGPLWGDTDLHFFGVSLFTKEYLVTAYNGKKYNDHEPTTSIIIFTKKGEYVATLELGYRTSFFCYDEINNRLIFCFDDEIQFGYIDINELRLN